MSKKIDLAKQAQALERLKAEFERLNRQFDELKAASGVASDDELVVDESKLPPEVRTAFLEMKAQAEKKYNYQLRFYDSGPMAIEDLLNGRIDAIVPVEEPWRSDRRAPPRADVVRVCFAGHSEFDKLISRSSL